jgi:hypothetical protein
MISCVEGEVKNSCEEVGLKILVQGKAVLE